MTTKYAVTIGFVAAFFLAVGLTIGFYFSDTFIIPLRSPFSPLTKKIEKPLLAYTIPALQQKTYQARTISIVKKMTSDADFTSYLFSSDALGRKMSGQLNVPTTVTDTTPVIVMIRGFVPSALFTTGVGTKNGATAFARAGFITIAPDFFGYGESDPEPTDSWQARFEKPIIVIELIKSIRETGIPIDETGKKITTNRVGLWGHSNGGQIALSTLVVLREAIPTSLWAPVTVPFPYSVMYFSDEDDDEGKGMRIWVSQLEYLYELRQFSFTQYLNSIAGPIQFHHGTYDEAAPKIWTDEFIIKLKKENAHREDTKKTLTASDSAAFTEPIEYKYWEYPGADHNLQPNENWQKVVERDIVFYREKISQ